MEIFNLNEGVMGHKRGVGFMGVKCADNLLYENRNCTGLLSFLQKINLKNILKSITSNRKVYFSCINIFNFLA